MLSWLGLLLTNRAHNRNERDVNEGDVLSSNPELELTECFQVWCAFDVTNCTTKFDDADIGRFIASISRSFGNIDDPILNGIGDVWDDLNRFSKIVATTFSFKHFGIDLTSRQIVVSSKVEVEEAFVIAEVKIDFATIVQHEDFTMLERTHGSSIAV